jgi:hypothetical protein
MEHLTAGDPEGLQAAESGPALHPSLHHLHLQDLQLLHTKREIIAGSGPESIRRAWADLFPFSHFGHVQFGTYRLGSVNLLPLLPFLLENIRLKFCRVQYLVAGTDFRCGCLFISTEGCITRVLDPDPLGSASFWRSGSVSISTKCKAKFHYFQENFTCNELLFQILKITLPMTLPRKIKQSQLALLWIKFKIL